MEFFWSRDLILCVILYQHTKFEPNRGQILAICPKAKMVALQKS